MAGGSCQELKLRDTTCLCPRRSYKDVGRPQGKIYPGTDHQEDGPLGEGSPCRPGMGCLGRRG